MAVGAVQYWSGIRQLFLKRNRGNIQLTMASHSDDFMVQNLKKVEECKRATLNSVAYKRGVPSALSCKCPLEDCGKIISRSRDLLTHIKTTHKLNHLCECNLFFPPVSDMERHGFYVHKIPK